MRKIIFIYKINEFNIVYLKNFYINNYIYLYESNNTLKNNYPNSIYKNKFELISIGFKKMKSIFQLIFVSIHKHIL